MVLLIGGASHTGKTALAQRLLEKYKIPYLSIDHLKMGLIRSGSTSLAPTSDDNVLTDYLWGIVKEIIKTTVENKQNLIVEGCYIPFDWKKSFDEDYLEHIKYRCIIMTENYIQNHYNDIAKYADIIEQRLDCSDCTIEMFIKENRVNLESCKKYNLDYLLIDSLYNVDWDIEDLS